MDRFDLAEAIRAGMGLVRRVDGFINLTEPYRLANDATRREELGAILYQCAEAVRIASLLLWPALPQRMADLWQALGLPAEPGPQPLDELAAWGGLSPGGPVTKVALFPRIDQPKPAPAGS